MPHQFIEIEKTLTQADFDRFAMLSGDDNPIHVDPDFSATTRFGRTVAHGMLLHTVFRGLLHQLLPGATQEEQHLTFPAPTFANEAMTFSVRIESHESESATASMTCQRVNDGVVTCDGLAVMTMPQVSR